MQPLDTCDVLELCVILIIRGSLAIRRGQYRCPVTVQKEQQGIFRCRAGVGGQGSHEAMESPKALMCPLEKGDRKMGGLTSRHQTTGRVRVFATANT